MSYLTFKISMTAILLTIYYYNPNVILFYCCSHSPSEPPRVPDCGHPRGNRKDLLCSTLTILDIQIFHSVFYSSMEKSQQDNFILTHTKLWSVAHHHPRNSSRSSKEFTYSYIFKKEMEVKCKFVRRLSGWFFTLKGQDLMVYWSDFKLLELLPNRIMVGIENPCFQR